jgi:hypothetical protein
MDTPDGPGPSLPTGLAIAYLVGGLIVLSALTVMGSWIGIIAAFTLPVQVLPTILALELGLTGIAMRFGKRVANIWLIALVFFILCFSTLMMWEITRLGPPL